MPTWLTHALIPGVLLLLIAWVGRRLLWPLTHRAWRDWRRGRRLRRGASAQLELATAYLAHLRDGVMPAVAQVASHPDEVRDYVRTNILKPIRGYVATEPGEHVKVVWFRPDEDGQMLKMHVQVGHTPEGQAAMRLPVGAGAAGTAFTSGETVYCRDCATDPVFAPVRHGHAEGINRVRPDQARRKDDRIGFWLAEEAVLRSARRCDCQPRSVRAGVEIRRGRIGNALLFDAIGTD